MHLPIRDAFRTSIFQRNGDIFGLEKLYLGQKYLKLNVGTGNVPKRFPSLVKNLKILLLDCLDFYDLEEMSRTLCLIRSSPKLVELDIVVRHSTLICLLGI
ncbi:F-box/FBD/LRR-repeat protein [Quillaja saponaria]|uniref:F-box/FBD/LRR-repeat protein n=1 Tax=Quillaja saponaria TaxID=32244 RepID=A0AAD7PGF3_QUISA|nr:F-box/FBD/LRR-repeat protein [Quillaja saponaria]